ncbi:hypothetical protein OAP56_02235 [Rickettsiaceae bacterium]|nr:hypothetical protein [Rickettsiaceae bacterium]
MEQINKLLIFLVGLAIAAIVYVVYDMTGKFSDITSKFAETVEKSIEKTVENKNMVIPPHPYNECIKLLIDQVNKENKDSDFEKMKAVCFVLSDKEKN